MTMSTSYRDVSDEVLVKLAGESYEQGRNLDDDLLHEILRRAFHTTPQSSLAFACADRLLRPQFERRIKASRAFAVLADRQGGELVADVLQEGYLNALKAMRKCPDFFAKFPGPYAFVAYLNKCFLSVILTQVNVELKYNFAEIPEEVPDETSAAAVEVALDPAVADPWESLEQLIAPDLTAKQWELFRLRYQAGRTPKQIAALDPQFGPNAGAVSSELYRVVQLIRRNRGVRELAARYEIDLGRDGEDIAS